MLLDLFSTNNLGSQHASTGECNSDLANSPLHGSFVDHDHDMPSIVSTGPIFDPELDFRIDYLGSSTEKQEVVEAKESEDWARIHTQRVTSEADQGHQNTAEALSGCSNVGGTVNISVTPVAAVAPLETQANSPAAYYSVFHNPQPEFQAEDPYHRALTLRPHRTWAISDEDLNIMRAFGLTPPPDFEPLDSFQRRETENLAKLARAVHHLGTIGEAKQTSLIQELKSQALLLREGSTHLQRIRQDLDLLSARLPPLFTPDDWSTLRTNVQSSLKSIHELQRSFSALKEMTPKTPGPNISRAPPSFLPPQRPVHLQHQSPPPYHPARPTVSHDHPGPPSVPPLPATAPPRRTSYAEPSRRTQYPTHSWHSPPPPFSHSSAVGPNGRHFPVHQPIYP
ncbi:hypothetical protein AAF712_010622 [Marasmius tenuissimus]|uniref:Uncharacterized protein n=1 Tax=Marasmius tenuissimus TaxID=585030 RepID=A0ABR2ZNB9_9AGAR